MATAWVMGGVVVMATAHAAKAKRGRLRRTLFGFFVLPEEVDYRVVALEMSNDMMPFDF